MTTRMPVINFLCRENHCTQRKGGTKINKWLVVSPATYDSYKIYKIHDGLPLIETEFRNREKAIELAQWVAKKYDGYFDIWEAWPECELLRVAQYTIPDGENVYKEIERVSSYEYIG